MNIDLNEQNDESEPRQVRVPFLNRPVGAGDVVKQATSALGVKPCTPCEERRKKMNQRLQFVPMGWA